ncbi:MAG TPA: hypothetical protein PLP11_05770 [Bacteroidales bacterium]|nr:hypothetical protein [Bacteroidales bacterium]
MEYNTLDLHIPINLDKAGSFIYDLLTTLDKNGIKIPSIADWDYDLRKAFNSVGDVKIFDTEFFKDKRFPYEVRLYLICNNHRNLNNSEKWFEFAILFKTSQLANDKENDDYFMSDFKYSTSCKETILQLCKNLSKVFPEAYITFTNEYNDCGVIEFIENFDFAAEIELYSDFEMAIVPKTKLGNCFATNGQIIDCDNNRILIRNDFMINNE